LELEKIKLLQEKINAKKKVKECESMVEKRARRLRKKAEKERKRQELIGFDKSALGYTNEDNPFGDEKLLDTFVWRKKMDKDGKTHLTETEQKRLIQSRQAELAKDLEKVKAARMAREHERSLREREKDQELREMDSARFQQWSQQEEHFHLKQARLRSKIRIKDGRAKAIDLLARYLDILEGNDAVDCELHEPYIYMNGLKVTELEDLQADIEVYQRLDESEVAQAYWKNILIVGDENLKALDGNRDRNRSRGIKKSVKDDVLKMFSGKSVSMLDKMSTGIQTKIARGSKAGADVGYWEQVASELKIYRARMELQEAHRDLLDRIDEAKDEAKKEEVTEESKKDFKRPNAPEYSKVAQKAKTEIQKRSTDNQPKIMLENRSLQEIEEEKRTKQEIAHCIELYEDKCYTPPLIDKPPPKVEIIQAALEVLQLEEKRRLIRTDSVKIKSAVTTVKRDTLDDAFLKEAKKDMTNEEAQFSVEAQLENQVYKWANKYKPRKPRFFNRVHTGYEWNKYNQTHYDFDNPPPKIVQGYKLNVFYPDLIDKTKSPDYKLTTMTENPEFAILRITAGPPYEDIAFKIVNREWDFGNKKGFRCQFMNGIFQLWFFYKRYRYRR